LKLTLPFVERTLQGNHVVASFLLLTFGQSAKFQSGIEALFLDLTEGEICENETAFSEMVGARVLNLRRLKRHHRQMHAHTENLLAVTIATQRCSAVFARFQISR